MKKFRFFLLTATLALAAFGATAQDSIVKTNLTQAEIDRIIKAFSVKEGESRVALTQYVFNRSAAVSTGGFAPTFSFARKVRRRAWKLIRSPNEFGKSRGG